MRLDCWTTPTLTCGGDFRSLVWPLKVAMPRFVVVHGQTYWERQPHGQI